MSDEARVTSSLNIAVGELSYRSLPSSFLADVAMAKGPTPGVITVTTGGVNVDLSELTVPALCRFMNLDATNRVEYGIYDPETVKFYPLGELLAGESYVLRLSRNIEEEYGTGTGTTGADTNRLRFKAYGGTCYVLVEAFET